MRLFTKLLLAISLWAPLSADVRAAIDVGSGGPKLRVAEIDPITNKIVTILHIKHYPILFEECLSRSGKRELSFEIMHQGLTAIKDAISTAKSFGTDEVALIGASPFRNAVNAEQFTDLIHSETGLKVHILDQELEGKLAFQAAQAKIDMDTHNLIVWDIGGSTQFTGIFPDGFRIDASNEGSGTFLDFIIESIQFRNPTHYRSPNPLTLEHARLAEEHARILSAKIDQVFKDKIRSPTTQIIGVGSVFSNGIAPLMGGKNPFTVEDLTIVVNGLIGKTDAELGGGVFACYEVSSALLVLGYMKGLGIQEMRIVDVNNADGALVYSPFWE